MALRPPATPLITHDPYFSIWSASDRLTDEWPRHWTGAPHPLCGMIRIDGQAFRFMGPQPHGAPALEQTSLEVLPTRTIYTFAGAGVQLTLTFLTPALPHDLDMLSLPITAVLWDAVATDGGSHEVSVYLDASMEIAVNAPTDAVAWGRMQAPGLRVMRVGSQDQRVLAKVGDNLRIDWGHLYLAVPGGDGASTAIVPQDRARGSFARTGQLPDTDDPDSPRPASDRWPVLACALSMGTVGAEPVRRHAFLAFDDNFSLEHFHRRLRPYWRRNGAGPLDILADAQRDLTGIEARCAEYDADLMADLAQAGGEDYARLCALAFRQCLAAHKLAEDGAGGFVFFSKENFSNGCIDTVDVTYPSSPFFLLLNPDLLKAQIGPIMDYAASDAWPFPFAPHDLGTYPLANGQVYGLEDGTLKLEYQMPVEECGNMLLMAAALAHVEGNAEYARGYWPVLSQWAEYLREKGLDPENQLCTDDFAGHLAHNTNLSIKAILGIAGYARLCHQLGQADRAEEFGQAAREMASAWMQRADDGDHYRLTFDGPGTWSQKYNLVWDGLLGLGVFPADVAKKEVAFYKTKLERYGLPLDSRRTYTKTDWEVWTAALAEEKPDFDAFLAPIIAFLNETPSRVPLSDWYETTDARQVGFQARSVVGGVFLPVLRHARLWEKWTKRARGAGKTASTM